MALGRVERERLIAHAGLSLFRASLSHTGLLVGAYNVPCVSMEGTFAILTC
jgi:hypothetical protein